jgi:small subunit ribosomal protein S25e
MKLVTIAAVADRLKVTGSLARAGIRELVQRGLLRAVSYHSKSPVYTRATSAE